MRVELTENIEFNWTLIVYSGDNFCDIATWLADLDCHYSTWGIWHRSGMEFFFESPEDAMLFKLTWI